MDQIKEAIADMLRTDPEFVKAEPCFVSIYNHERCFGGPEEGGWWYDVYTLEGGKPFLSREAAETYLTQADIEVQKRNRDNAPARAQAMANLPDDEPAGYDEGYIPTRWSDGGELWIVIEDTLGSHDNSRNDPPRYE
jgi:hypothetical protein